MVIRKPYLFAAPVLVIIAIVTASLPHHRANASLPISGNATVVSSPRVETSLSSPLNSSDRGRYGAIFEAQKQADWQTADALINQLDNTLLLGHVYAERYLHRKYKTSAAELTAWLKDYSDLPQAYDIYTLANAKAVKTPAISKERTLQGYGDDNGLAANFGDSKYAGTWSKAIGKWRAGSKAEAANLFTGMLKDDALPKWKKSAAAFWAYRSYSDLGDKKSARKYLEIAASEPRSFYGILARKQMKQSLGLDAAPAKLSVDDRLDMLGQPATRRILALSETGRTDLAEKELRALFPSASEAEKFRLLALAHELNLASVQIAMARQLASDDHALDYARYPIPHWEPQNGFKVEPSLIYALVRQESGFRASAVSPVGALGLMQLMPKTATYMKKQMASEMLDNDRQELPMNESDPTFNIALGQQYVQHLLENDTVEGNLIYMLVAYNAGAGRLSSWKETIAYKNDPLLFIESIPFAETRHYVMQVMTNYWIYSELAGNSGASAVALLSGKWPQYDQQSLPLASKSILRLLDKTG